MISFIKWLFSVPQNSYSFNQRVTYSATEKTEPPHSLEHNYSLIKSVPRAPLIGFCLHKRPKEENSFRCYKSGAVFLGDSD